MDFQGFELLVSWEGGQGIVPLMVQKSSTAPNVRWLVGWLVGSLSTIIYDEFSDTSQVVSRISSINIVMVLFLLFPIVTIARVLSFFCCIGSIVPGGNQYYCEKPQALIHLRDPCKQNHQPMEFLFGGLPKPCIYLRKGTRF